MTGQQYSIRLGLLISLAYGGLLLGYIQVTSYSIQLTALRLPTFDLSKDMGSLAMGYLYALIPLLWIRGSQRISKVLYIYLYIAVLIPSILFLVMNEVMDPVVRHIRALACVFCFFVIYCAYLVPLKTFQRIRRQRELGWGIVCFVAILGPLYFVLSNPSMLLNVRFIDVYTQRLDLRDAIAAGNWNVLNVYLTNWMGIAIAPFLGAYGIHNRKPAYVLWALLVAYIAFAASTHKSVFFTTMIVLTFAGYLYFSRRNFLVRNLTISVSIVIVIGFILTTYLIDVFLGLSTAIIWLTGFRMFMNNGFLTSVYMEFFSNDPFLLYANSFLSGFISSEFDLSYARRIGNYITNYDSRNNANGNFLADGYVNLGYIGMIFSSLQLAFVLWLMDCLGRNRSPALVACMILPSGLVFSNVPVHTGLVSNGVAICILLITLLPIQRTALQSPTPQMRPAQGYGT